MTPIATLLILAATVCLVAMLPQALRRVKTALFLAKDAYDTYRACKPTVPAERTAPNDPHDLGICRAEHTARAFLCPPGFTAPAPRSNQFPGAKAR